MASKSLDILVGMKGANAVLAGFHSLTGGLKNFGAELIGMTAILESGPLGLLTTLLDGAKEVFKQTAEGEKSVEALREALKLAGDGTASTLDHFKEFANQIQATTTLTDDAVNEAGRLGAAMGGLVGDQLEKATKAAIGLSERMGTDLQGAMELVVKAGVGFDGALAKHGIILNQNASAQDKFNQLLKIGTDAFPLAEAKAKTMSGAIARFENQLGDVAKSIGSSFAPAFDVVLTKLGDFTAYIAEAIPPIMDTIKGGFDVVWDFIVPPFQTAFNEVMPLVEEFGNVLIAGTATVTEAWGKAWTWAAGVFKSSFDSIRDYLPAWDDVKQSVLTGLTTIEFSFTHMRDLIAQALLGAAGTLSEWSDRVKFGFDYTTDIISKAMLDSFEFVKTFITNAATNVWNFLKAVGSWISGDGFNFEWTGLTKGFESAFKQLPGIGEFHISETTKLLNEAYATLGEQNGDAYVNALNQRFDDSKTSAERTVDFLSNLKLPDLGPKKEADKGENFSKSKQILAANQSGGSANEAKGATIQDSPFLTGLAQSQREMAINMQQRHLDIATKQLDEFGKFKKTVEDIKQGLPDWIASVFDGIPAIS